jgi:hypothetical protein
MMEAEKSPNCSATPYGLREFGHVDPEGNLLRIGSPLRQAEA